MESVHKGMRQAGIATARCTNHPDGNKLSENQCGSPVATVTGEPAVAEHRPLRGAVSPAPLAPVRSEELGRAASGPQHWRLDWVAYDTKHRPGHQRGVAANGRLLSQREHDGERRNDNHG